MPTTRYIPYESKTRKSITYQLVEFEGRYICNCPGFDRKRWGECPHTDEDRELRSLLMTTDVAIRQHGTNLVPEGFKPVELRPPVERLPSTGQFEMMMRIASMAVEGANKADAKDRALPITIRTAEQAMTIMLAGYELGLPPMSALRRLYIVNGRVELETQALMGLVIAGDPTAHFRFNRYDQYACSVTLFRQGEEMITCEYTKDDATQAGQLKDLWYRAKDFDTKQPLTVLKDSYNLKPGQKFGGPAGASGRVYVLEAGKSVWSQFTRDMLAYSAIKRCCRLGAPELTNQILPPSFIDAPYQITETARATGDEDGAPTNEISKRLIEGDLHPGEVFGGDAAPEAADRVDEDEPPTEPAPAAPTAPARPRAAPAASAPPPAQATKPDPRLVQAITDRMTLLNKGNAEQSPIDPVAYKALFTKIRDEYMGGPNAKFDPSILNAAAAAAVWEMIRPEEPPAVEVDITIAAPTPLEPVPAESEAEDEPAEAGDDEAPEADESSPSEEAPE